MMVNKKVFRKTKWKMVLSFLLVFVMIISSISVYGFNSYATSASTETEETTESTTEGNVTDNGTTDASIEKARQDAAQASKSKKAAKRILDSLKDAKNNMENYVIQLDKSLNELQIEITHLELNQKELEKTIDETQQKLKVAQAAQEEQYSAMKDRIQMVYEAGNKRYLDVLLTATSMTDMLNKSEYILQVSAYDYNILEELKTAREQVANLKQKLDKDLKNNEAMQEEVNQQRATMEALVEEKNAQIAQYNQSIAGQQEEVNKYAQAQAEAEAIIAAAEQAASSSSTSSYGGGVFTWPVPGYTQITSYFGGRDAPVAGAISYHKGIDIDCSTGASVVAATSGTVIVATYNYAEGNYVCIDHGGGVVTVYMHNSSLLVSVGETVSAGQQIAAAGSTGISTGPHCHFGVRVDGTYVDPLGYLQ